MAEPFALGDILSITTGRLVSRDHMSGVHRILDFMTGDQLFTHALIRASQECKPKLLAQHPQLAGIEVPDDLETAEQVYAWLATQEAIYGETLPVEPLAAEDHTVINPIAELKMMRPDLPIIAVTEDGVKEL